ncbi:hypothetical protein FI667_g15734, partial [Globisporangium splendens]
MLTFMVDLWTTRSAFVVVYTPVALDEHAAVSAEKAQVLGRLMRRCGHFARDDRDQVARRKVDRRQPLGCASCLGATDGSTLVIPWGPGRGTVAVLVDFAVSTWLLSFSSLSPSSCGLDSSRRAACLILYGSERKVDIVGSNLFLGGAGAAPLLLPVLLLRLPSLLLCSAARFLEAAGRFVDSEGLDFAVVDTGTAVGGTPEASEVRTTTGGFTLATGASGAEVGALLVSDAAGALVVGVGATGTGAVAIATPTIDPQRHTHAHMSPSYRHGLIRNDSTKQRYFATYAASSRARRRP